jgi:hypothetical protein
LIKQSKESCVSRVNKKQVYLPTHMCKFCNEIDPEEFYENKKSVCKSCEISQDTSKKRQLKVRAVELLGGKCSCCGYNKYIGALEFHHKNPSEKDFEVVKTLRKWESILKELNKCVLLCANCHREEHAMQRGTLKRAK